MSNSKKGLIAGNTKRTFSQLNMILVIQLFIMLVLTIIVTILTSVKVQHNAIDNLKSINDQKAHIIAEFVEQSETTLRQFVMADQVKNVVENPDDEQALREAQDYLMEFAGSLGEIEGLYICDWNTKTLAHSNPDNIGVVTHEEEERLENLRNNLMNEGPDGIRKNVTTSPVSNKQCFVFIKPYINDAGEYIGIIGLAVYTDKFINQIETHINGLDEYYYTISDTSDATYIYDKDKEKIDQPVEYDELKQLCERLKDNPEEETNHYYFNTGGRRYASIYTYLPETGWILSVNDNTTELFALATNLTVYMIIFAIVVVGLIVVFNIISRKQETINNTLISAIAKNNQTKKSLNTAMFKDVLTDVNNRVAFAMEIEKINEEAPKPYYFALFNICGFSNINTQFGNDSGDLLLVRTVDVIKENFPNGNIYRTGSDEFVLIVETENNIPSKESVMDKINTTLRELTIPVETEGFGTMYPKYKVAVAGKDGNVDSSVISVLKDVTNQTGEAVYGMIDFLDMNAQ